MVEKRSQLMAPVLGKNSKETRLLNEIDDYLQRTSDADVE